MSLTLLLLGIYFIGCLIALPLFLLGGWHRLSQQNWFWPVIFLWPLLALWPLYAITEAFLKWKIRKQE
jgi:hypothetical protein